MATITEDYVSFETAKLLKEKGFDGPCYKVWESHCNSQTLVGAPCFVEGETIVNKESVDAAAKQYVYIYNLNNKVEGYLAPTLQMAMKWLRKVHGLFVSIGNDDLDYNWQIFDIKNRTKDLDPTCLTESYAGYRKYEQAVEAAIKYCLENLI